MTDRINIRALREIAAPPLDFTARLPRRDLLALVEAVEALKAIRALPSKHDLMLNAEARAMYDMASFALARFDFEEET